MSKEVMQMALDALENAYDAINTWGGYASAYFQEKHGLEADVSECRKSIEALRAALAQPDPEPVAYVTKRKIGGTEGLLWADMVDMSPKNKETHYFIALYTALPQCKPLSKEKVKELCRRGPVYALHGVVTKTPIAYREELEAAMLSGIRICEAAHGIKEES